MRPGAAALVWVLLAAPAPAPATPVRPGAAHGERQRMLLEVTQELARRLSLETGWAQAWLRALETPPTAATATLDDARLIQLGEDLVGRLMRLRLDLEVHRAAWANPDLHVSLDRARHLTVIERLLASTERILEIPGRFLLVLRKRSRGR